jgi:hypothetical protein
MPGSTRDPAILRERRLQPRGLRIKAAMTADTLRETTRERRGALQHNP